MYLLKLHVNAVAVLEARRVLLAQLVSIGVVGKHAVEFFEDTFRYPVFVLLSLGAKIGATLPNRDMTWRN